MGRAPVPIGTVIAALLLGACLVGIWVETPFLAAATAAMVAAFVIRLAVQARNHRRLARSLRRDSLRGTHEGVAVRWRALTAGALVAGLRDPQIYCDRGLADRLSDQELTAIVLHERHHQLRRDPLRLLLLSSIEPAVGRFQAGARWLTRQRAALEIAADRFVLEHGVSRSALARAILRVGDAPPVRYAAAGFSSAQELRLRALVDGQDARASCARSAWLSLAASLGLVAVVCGTAILHHTSATGGSIGCVLPGC